MSHFGTLRFYWDPKLALQDAMHEAANDAHQGDILGPDVIDFLGYRTLQWTFIDASGEIRDHYYILMTIPEGRVESAQSVLRSPVQFLHQRQFAATGDPYPTWLELVADFEYIYAQFIVTFFEDVCEAFITVGETSALLAADDQTGVVGIPVTVLTDADVLVFGMTATGHESTTDDYIIGIANFYETSVAQVSVAAGAPGADISPVVEALQDIADQDYEIAINNGQAVFRVRGRATITGPGGEGG